MAMDIRLSLFWIMYYIYTSFAHDLYMCSWPVNEVAQIRCDYTNCPYLSIDHMTVGRLVGPIGDCPVLNGNESTRIPIDSCTYKVTENNVNKDFLMQAKANCSRKEVCEIHTRKEWLFQSAGNCGQEVNDVFSIRNWVHIEYSCIGDIPGLKCVPKVTTSTTTTTTTTTTESPQTEAVQTTQRRRMTRPTTPGTATRSNMGQIVTLIIPILGTLLFLTFVLIIATVLYRHRICRKTSWKKTVEERLKVRDSQKHNQHPRYKIDDAKHYKIDSSKLKELEKRLNSEHTKTNNDYFHDLTFTNQAKSVESLPDYCAQTRPSNRRGRRGSVEHQTQSAMLPGEMYFSDSSISTTTTEDCDFDSNGRRKRRHTPFPPLPKPVVRHSEVYFTETETESEALQNRRKDVIPKVTPPPKVHRERKHERLRPHKSNSVSDINARTSLDLALTKLAAKKLTAHEQRAKLAGKKPASRPRSNRPSSVIYGNSTNTYPVNFLDQMNTPKRSNTMPSDNVYRNVI